MEHRLRLAVAQDQIGLHYQPVVALPSGRVTGVEALARWEDDELGTVPPDEFITLAERTGLILDLGRAVLRAACQQATAWPASPTGSPTVSVNVSPVQLVEPSFTAHVQAALEDSGLEASRLCLEITETAAVTDLQETADRLWQLRRLGVQLALDDFGTGYSSLTLLRRLPVHLVKIDRSFMEKVAVDAGDAVLVRLVVDAAHSLGLRVCAEGIEQVDQARQMVAMGCDSAQGWLFGRPVPPTPALASMLTSQPDPFEAFDPALPPPVVLGGSDDLVVVTTPDLVVSYVSASCRAVLGRVPSELVGAQLPGLDSDDYPDGRTTLRLSHRDGTDRWLRGDVQRLHDDAGDVREVLWVFHDVTGEVVREQALAASERLFRLAFDDAPIGMALTALDGRILRANAAFAELVGRRASDLLSMCVADLTHPDDLAADETNLAAIRAGTASSQRVAKRYRSSGGHDVRVTVHAATVTGADGEPAYVVAHVLPA